MLGFGAVAQATVSLSFSQLSVNIDKVLQNPPQATVTLNLVSTAEQTTGIDYYLTALGNANGHFVLIDRNIGASLYNDLINTDTDVEAQPASLLDPTTDLDLGGNSAAPVTSGTRPVASYTLRVLPGTPNGSYVVETFSQPNTGWVDQNGGEFQFTNQASLNIIVVPEPASVGLLGLVGLVGLWRGRRV
jgi:hypothetical protein